MKSSLFGISLLALSGVCSVVPASSTDETLADNIARLIRDLRGGKESVRAEAEQRLGGVKNAGAIAALLRIAGGSDEDWAARIAAIRLLAGTGDARAADLLINISGDPCPAVRLNAVTMLGKFRGGRVVGGLIEAMRDDLTPVREAAMQSLGEIGSPEAVLPLASALGDRNYVIRLSAVRALGAIGDPRAIPFLKETAFYDADPSIREEALMAIIGIVETAAGMSPAASDDLG